MSGFQFKGRDIQADQVEDTISKIIGVSGGAITAGNLVICNGKVGQKLRFVRASSDTSTLSRGSLWVATDTVSASGMEFTAARFYELALDTSLGTVGNPVYLAPAGTTNVALSAGTFNVEVGKITVAATVANGGKVLIEPRAGGASISTSTTGLTFTVNTDADSLTDEDPALILLGGDGTAAPNDDLVRSQFRQDSPLEIVQVFTARSRNGGAYANVTPVFAIGARGETTATLDAYLEFNAATNAGLAVTSQLRFMGQENRYDLMTAANFAGIMFDGTNVVTAVFDYSALATGEADYILGGNLASAVAWRVGGTDIMSIDTTTGSVALDIDALVTVNYSSLVAASGIDVAIQPNDVAGTALYSGVYIHNLHGTNRAAGSIVNGVYVLVDSEAADDAAAIYRAYCAETDGTDGVHQFLHMGSGFDAFADVSSALTGEADFILGANLASAMAWRVSTVDVMSIDTTTNVLALDLDATLDIDYALGAAGDLANLLLDYSIATGGAAGLRVGARQLAGGGGLDRTADQLNAIYAFTAGRAGDTATVVYSDYVAGAPTVVSGGVHAAFRVEGNHDLLMYLVEPASGANRIGLAVGSAEAYGYGEFNPLSAGYIPYFMVDTVLGESAYHQDVALRATAQPKGFNALPPRYELRHVAGSDGLIQLNAAAAYTVDKFFEILGMNASSDDVTFSPEGGLICETDGADGDEVIILPHLTANLSPWTSTTWGTDKEVIWECDITSGSNITNCIIWAGLKLTNTEVPGTDNDEVFFRYEDDVNGGEWQVIEDNGGAAYVATDTGYAAAINTRYHLKIIISAARVASCYINDQLVRTTAALAAAADLIPYIGVAADGAAAVKRVIYHGQAISRDIG